MNYTQGSVTFQPGGEGDWVTAVPNRPLTTGDNLWSDQGSRAEMHVGSTAVRLAPETSVTFLELDDRTTQLRLSAGTIILRVRHLDDGDLFEVDTPNLAFNLQHPGEYRVDVDSNGDVTNVSVFSGRGEGTGQGSGCGCPWGGATSRRWATASAWTMRLPGRSSEGGSRRSSRRSTTPR